VRSARAFSIARRRGLALGAICGDKSQAAGQNQHSRGSQLSSYALAKHRRAYSEQPSPVRNLPLRLHHLNYQRRSLMSLSHVRCHQGSGLLRALEVGRNRSKTAQRRGELQVAALSPYHVIEDQGEHQIGRDGK
jgi:hypothetical protein